MVEPVQHRTSLCCDVVCFGTVPDMLDVLAVAMYELDEATQVLSLIHI